MAFRSATEPFDTSTPVGRMLVQMLGVFAEFERDVIINRVIAGMERKAAKGLWTGGTAPIGYAVDKKAHNYVIVDTEAAIVRRTQFTCAQRILTSAANRSDSGPRTPPWTPSPGRSPAHGRNNRYRFYMCWSRNRYGACKGCDIHRFNADELETAIGQALLDFYTGGHDAMEQAISEFLTATTRAPTPSTRNSHRSTSSYGTTRRQRDPTLPHPDCQ